MLIISRTPVRISLFGGGTDYPGYYSRHVGAVLGTTIDKYTHVSISTPGNYFDHRIRIGYSKTELVKTFDEIEHPSIRECLKLKNCDSNLDIHIFSDLPAKTGLGSSSSFTVGFLNALYALRGMKVSKQVLAEEACFVEQELIRENVGSQDQFHAAFGGVNVIEFNADNKQIRPVIATPKRLKIFEEHLLLFYTGLTRYASEILKEQMERTHSLTNDAYLKRMYEMVFIAEDIIAHEAEDTMMSSLGRLLDESWSLKKQLSSKISNPIVDQAYETAKQAGAYGGKLCGAGSGGFLALLVPPSRQDAVKAALHNLMAVPVCFENSGSTIIYMKD
ncbi:MAG: hypothetical protein KGZ39_07390 [Simkania sp.]|nr:hypothetical protein [Simkania sp.]